MRASLTPFPPLWALNSNAFNYQTRLTSYFFVLPFWGGGDWKMQVIIVPVS